jgi:hypothetical protein
MLAAAVDSRSASSTSSSGGSSSGSTSSSTSSSSISKSLPLQHLPPLPSGPALHNHLHHNLLLHRNIHLPPEPALARPSSPPVAASFFLSAADRNASSSSLPHNAASSSSAAKRLSLEPPRPSTASSALPNPPFVFALADADADTDTGPEPALAQKPLRSPSASPRKRSTTFGSRYSPPPASFDSRSPAVPNIPVTPSIPKSPLALENTAATTDFFSSGSAISPTKKAAAPAVKPLAAASASTADDSARMPQLAPPLPRNAPHRRSVSSSMATQANMRAVAEAKQTFHVKKPSFSSDMRHTTAAAAVDHHSKRYRDPKDRDRDRKELLSKALQKAHTAVVLDNAHNSESAVVAYEDACELLEQVLVRSTADQERKKLEEIVSRVLCRENYD